MKWGIIGTGKIARRFANDLRYVPGATLMGVTSRNQENNKKFAEEFVSTSYEKIEDLLKSDVEIIYIATPHSSHKDHAMMAIHAGKAVLCEKPFAMNSAESLEMVNLARKKNVFLMEAMWTRFFPAIKEIIEHVKDGSIGQLVRIESNFGYQSVFDPASRIFNPALGGGSILDVGVYSISLVRMLIPQMPATINGSAVMSSTGVDESAVWEMTFSSGVTARGESSVVNVLQNEARIIGTKGEIRIPKFWCPREYYLNEEHRTFEFEGMGFQFEAQEVMRNLQLGLKESPLMPFQHTLDVMMIMDKLKQEIIWDRKGV